MSKFLHILGVILGIATPIAVAAQSEIPTNTKIGVTVGVIAALLTNLSRAFGDAQTPTPKP